jgi:hypothetical protein
MANGQVSPADDIASDSSGDQATFRRYIEIFAQCPVTKDSDEGTAIVKKLRDLNAKGKIEYNSAAIPGTAIAASDHIGGISIREYCRGKDQCMTELFHEAAHLVYTERRGALLKQHLISREELKEERARKKLYRGWDPHEEFFAYMMQVKVYMYLRDQDLILPDGRLEKRRKAFDDGRDYTGLMNLVIEDHQAATAAAAGQ